MSNKLVIVSNESIFEDNEVFYCDNIDMKSIPEGLSKNRKVSLIARKSNIKRSLKISAENIIISSNIFFFYLIYLKLLRKKKQIIC